MVEYIKQLENIFVENFNDLASNRFIGAKLKDLFKTIPFTHPCPRFPFDYFLSLYNRVPIYFTVKFANRDIKNQIRNKQPKKPNIKLNILQNL